MCYEERIIDGKLYGRTDPRGEWIEIDDPDGKKLEAHKKRIKLHWLCSF